METSLAITTQERPQHAMARREAADPLAEILAGQLSEHARRAYRHDLGHLLAFLEEGPALAWGGLTLAEKHALIERACADPDAVSRLLTLTRAELITFRTHLKEVGLSTLAVNRRLAGVGTVTREPRSATIGRGRIWRTTPLITWRGRWGRRDPPHPRSSTRPRLAGQRGSCPQTPVLSAAPKVPVDLGTGGARRAPYGWNSE